MRQVGERPGMLCACDPQAAAIAGLTCAHMTHSTPTEATWQQPAFSPQTCATVHGPQHQQVVHDGLPGTVAEFSEQCTCHIVDGPQRLEGCPGGRGPTRVEHHDRRGHGVAAPQLLHKVDERALRPTDDHVPAQIPQRPRSL